MNYNHFSSVEDLVKFADVGEFYLYQDQNMERIHKNLFGEPSDNTVNRYWLEKVENAGDIGRELSKYNGEWVAPDYIGEKISKLRNMNREYFEYLPPDQSKERDMILRYKQAFDSFYGELTPLLNISKSLSYSVLDRNYDEVMSNLDLLQTELENTYDNVKDYYDWIRRQEHDDKIPQSIVNEDNIVTDDGNDQVYNILYEAKHMGMQLLEVIDFFRELYPNNGMSRDEFNLIWDEIQ